MGGVSECQKNDQGGTPHITPSGYSPGGNIWGVWGCGTLVLGHSRVWDSREVLDQGPGRPSWWEVLGGQRVRKNAQTSVAQSRRPHLGGLGVGGASSRSLLGVGGWRAVGRCARRSVVVGGPARVGVG